MISIMYVLRHNHNLNNTQNTWIRHKFRHIFGRKHSNLTRMG